MLKKYIIDIGFSPVGDKYYEGDGKTPEGNYFINRKNPYSKFHLSIGISYPNERDRAEAATLGKPPGGDIFIHGESDRRKLGRNDWTWGCISVPNREIEEIYSMVKNGTPIKINP
jgi:murein L,D-transpeptidase YafK